MFEVLGRSGITLEEISSPLPRVPAAVNIVCYTPKFVKKAYQFPTTLDGSGQTIVIVDAFDSPKTASDLA